MNLSDDYQLAYLVGHESWYYDAGRERRGDGASGGRTGHYLGVQSGAQGGGCEWAFYIYEYRFSSGTEAIHLEMFDDAFAALAQVPEFFSELRDGMSLDDVRAVLDRLGAVDTTDRRHPGEPVTRVELVRAVDEARVRLAEYDATH